jgi:hypothetical protein
VAIIVPDAEYLKTWAPANGIAGSTMAEWCADPKVKKAILDDMNRIGKAEKVGDTLRQALVSPRLHLAPCTPGCICGYIVCFCCV